ncbi:MAG TPA: hypothetical protein PKH07_19765, partial [bacterium]|nr:hypothetical protein [bacterium]
TGCFGQAFDAVQTPKGHSRKIGGRTLEYFDRSAGKISLERQQTVTSGLEQFLASGAPELPKQESFRFGAEDGDITTVLRCSGEPLLSIDRKEQIIFIHGSLFAGACFDPDRQPPALFGSADASCNEHDPWGPYSASHPQNGFTQKLFQNILDYAKVDYRIPNPEPRTLAPYLGDHMETVSISANIVYNNMPETRSIVVRTPFPPKGYSSTKTKGRYETTVTVPAFEYVALEGF